MTEASAGLGWVGMDPPGVRALIMPLVVVLAILLTTELMEVEAILSILKWKRFRISSEITCFFPYLTKRSCARGGGGMAL